ncbi:MAG: HAMP domain-containing sensor histidine kinase [Actinomycetota bacterium]
MSLRARLLIVTVGLVAVGLVVADVLTYRVLASSLNQRVEEQLPVAQAYAFEALSHDGQGVPIPGPGGPLGDVGPPSGTYGAVLNNTGAVVHDTFFGESGLVTPPPPELPTGLPGSSGGGTGTSVFTASSSDGTDYRVQATGPVPSGGTLVVGIPLTEMQATLQRLLRIELLVTLAVIVLVAGLALWLVRIGLRPLEGIGQTAGAIAAGDLTRRVEPADDRTEVGRLGTSLNAMLAQIEVAFEERRASEARLRRFIADASHELRTPLTSIRGYAELFRRGAKTRPEDLETSMARIEAEAERMGVLVDDLLLLARLDQGRPLERDPVDLANIASDAVHAARAIDPARPIELDAGLPAMLAGDAGRLRQVIDNLLENARVHAPAGARTQVQVRTDGDEVVLTVADDGPGMDADTATRAFERFYRGDPARSRATGGAGLGLSIVAAIVEAHGGSVALVPTDPGATFEVRIPTTP